MLLELKIKNFALIEQVALYFSDGFNIITGETGAGKSILIDAVDFAMGGRTEAGMIRAGADRATVELVFEVPRVLRSEVRAILEANEISIPSLERATLTREIRKTGRSSARINGTVCKLAVYSAVSSILVDIHGQTEHLSLLTPKSHLQLLDRYADLVDTREAFATVYRKLQAIRQTIDSLQRNEQEREQRIDMLKFQISEIEAAALKAGEEEDLREERNRLANSEKLAKLCEEAYQALYGDDEFGNSGVNAINSAAAAVERLTELDPSLDEENALAEAAVAQVEALAEAIRHYRDGIDISPDRLNAVEERLEVISRLKRKYGKDIKAILERATRAQQELDDIELGEDRIEALAKEAETLLHTLGDLGKRLSERRLQFGRTLAEGVERQLKDLRMDGARFEVSISQEEDPDGCYVDDERLAFDITGVDQVEFLLSANPGEPLKPLAQVASGGETARIMLALKTILSEADRTPTLIFDEIDQGIGGRLGITVGQKLWGLSRNHQILCVTHLAQIAGFADVHFNVAKGQTGQRTITKVMTLPELDRLREMAEMLGSTSETALQNAQELYDEARRIKQTATS